MERYVEGEILFELDAQQLFWRSGGGRCSNGQKLVMPCTMPSRMA